MSVSIFSFASIQSIFCYIICILTFFPSASLLAQENRPNIIFILIDDQRYDFLSYLDHPWIQTPNIDALAENSFYFDRAYVTTSLCSPSRASILTSQYAHNHQVSDNNTPLPEGIPTFPQVLQKTGYTTAFVGKWHMGGSNDMPRPGFDYWASFKGQGPYTDPPMNVNGEIKQLEGYTPDILTEMSISFIKDQQNTGNPYCLYLSHKSIHEPFTPAPRHQGVYKELEIPKPPTFANTEDNYKGKPTWLKNQRTSWHGSERDFNIQDYGSYDRFFQLYSECMLGVDESVGTIVKALEELGQLEETVIIYFSDNGYMMGEHGLIDKRVMYEESIRVPGFIHWPEKVKAGRTEEFITAIDMGPTILDIANADVPPEMQGRSFLPLALGKEVSWRDDFVYEYFVDPNAVQTPTTFGLRTKKYSYMTYHGVWDTYELYDMETDPLQQHNLLGKVVYGNDYGTFLQHVERLEPELYPLVKKLDDRLTERIKELGGSRIAQWLESTSFQK